jgi:heterodisulfide reductase subunit D
MSSQAQGPVAGFHGISEEAYLPCIRCGQCSYTCPVYRVKLTQSFSPRGRLALVRAVNQGEASVTDNFATKFYSCTLCAACTQACPSGVQVDDLLLRVRAELAQRGALPPTLARLSRTLQETHNISGEDNDLRLIWTENLPRLPSGGDKSQAEVVYFVGCVGSFFPRSYSIPQAFVQTLEAAGVDYGLLGGSEWCCGYPLYLNGLQAEAEETIYHNIAAVRARGARQVVFTCPSCYHLWKHTYPQVAAAEMEGLEVLHASEFLAQLLDEGRLPLREKQQTVTYHDPCDLGRKGKIYDAPRRILQNLPGLTLVEMRDNRENGLCCGGGGNLETFDPGLMAEAAGRRLAQVQETGASLVVSACQQCERTLTNAARQQKLRIRVTDIVEIVWEAVRQAREGEGL